MRGEAEKQTARPNGDGAEQRPESLMPKRTARRKPRPEVAPPEAQWVTVGQLACELQVSRSHVLRAIHSGALPATLVGTLLRVRRQDAERWLEGQRWSPGLSGERAARPRAGRWRRGIKAAMPDALESSPAPKQ